MLDLRVQTTERARYSKPGWPINDQVMRRDVTQVRRILYIAKGETQCEEEMTHGSHPMSCE
jgi:hypothetical protein